MHMIFATGMLAGVLCACAAKPGPTSTMNALADSAAAENPPAANAPAANAPPEPVHIDAASMPEGMSVYTMVLLRRGPTWTAEQTPESIELGKGHMAHIRRMAEAGALRVAGPFLGQTDPDDLAGIYIFGGSDLDEVKRLTAQDPAVAAGRFVPEYLVWLGPDNLAPALEVPDPHKAPPRASDKAPPRASDNAPGSPAPGQP